MTFAKIAASIAALASAAKAVAPQAAGEIDQLASEAHQATQATETAVTQPATSELVQLGEAVAEPTVEAFVSKLLTPVFKANAPAVAAKFVAAGEAAITAF